MENTMEAVGRNCGTELGDASKCVEPQRALSQCAARAVPMLQTVKERCGPLIRAYDMCVSQYSQKSDDEVAAACTPKLRALWECTEAVKQETQS